MLQRLFGFHGGVKPAYNKEASTTQPIAVAPTPTLLVIPLHQSIGGPPRPLVAAGDRVFKGQRIGAADGNVSSAVHASTSGTVVAVEMRLMPHTSGLSALCVVIEPDGRDEWIVRQPFDFRAAAPHQTRDYLRDAGVVGLGGAVFPSYLKLTAGKQGRLDTLVLNGAECEPFITCDDVLMRERAEAILKGAAIMREMLAAGRVLIGIEDNKLQAIAAMEVATRAANQAAGDEAMQVVSVPTRYPAGGAKQLIRVLTGIEVPHGERSTEYGVQCFNVGTAYAIYEAIELGQPLISRIVTVAGNVGNARNFEVLFGTPMRDLIALCDPLPDSDRVIMGGPMMGLLMPANSVPVVKATNCILVGSKKLFPPPPPEMPCIRCGECAKVCPADLQPFEMYWFSRAKIFGKAQEYHLFDCIECGCCAYVCPSRIPLVDYYRFAKSEIWAREVEKESADQARERYEFRLLREERERQEKAAKLAAKTAAGREKAAAALAEAQKPAATPEEDAKKALIAAALERARAQKEQVQPENVSDLTPEQQAEVAAIEARRAEIREMAKPHLRQDD
ncbi:electron transport complex subunit RsxC [Sulfuritalea sp.]|uniref:electron transport complex subunit RsxC n=1 Tax=Sulfuritalea sp. TaxID=2480090 RepID=UPI00286DF089|nr:electron transport complex subunit RsxC [Sulfuritalea sp.]